MEKTPCKEMKVRLPNDLHQWLQAQSQSNDRSMNYLVVYAVKMLKQQREI